MQIVYFSFSFCQGLVVCHKCHEVCGLKLGMHKALALFALLTPTHADFDRKKAPLLDTTVDATAGHATTVRAPTRTQDEEDFAEAARLAGSAFAAEPVLARTQDEENVAEAARLAEDGAFDKADVVAPVENLHFLSNSTANGIQPITFVAKHGRLYANEQQFHLKGVNWFGSEGRAGPPGGLNYHPIDWYMDFLARHQFNAVRLLFNHESVLQNEPIETSEVLQAPELRGKTYLQMFGLVASAAAKRGLLVMLACHRMHPSTWPGEGLWFDTAGPITEEHVLQSWGKIADAFCHVWNVFAVDLQNEPHSASWGYGRPSTDWDQAASRIGQHVLGLCERWLVMVEGVGYQPGAPGGNDPKEGFWWGGNLVGAKVAPVSLDPPHHGATKDRLVYSPHTYGPGVYAQPYFEHADFPDNLEQVYERHWAFVAGTTGAPLVIGEMGGSYTGKDKIWLDWALGYCQRHGIGVFYFALNPNSKDTGGLLKVDWSTPEYAKLKALMVCVRGWSTHRTAARSCAHTLALWSALPQTVHALHALTRPCAGAASDRRAQGAHRTDDLAIAATTPAAARAARAARLAATTRQPAIAYDTAPTAEATHVTGSLRTSLLPVAAPAAAKSQATTAHGRRCRSAAVAVSSSAQRPRNAAATRERPHATTAIAAASYYYAVARRRVCWSWACTRRARGRHLGHLGDSCPRARSTSPASEHNEHKVNYN